MTTEQWSTVYRAVASELHMCAREVLDQDTRRPHTCDHERLHHPIEVEQ